MVVFKHGPKVFGIPPKGISGILCSLPWNLGRTVIAPSLEKSRRDVTSEGDLLSSGDAVSQNSLSKL